MICSTLPEAKQITVADVYAAMDRCERKTRFCVVRYRMHDKDETWFSYECSCDGNFASFHTLTEAIAFFAAKSNPRPKDLLDGLPTETILVQPPGVDIATVLSGGVMAHVEHVDADTDRGLHPGRGVYGLTHETIRVDTTLGDYDPECEPRVTWKANGVEFTATYKGTLNHAGQSVATFAIQAEVAL